MTLTERINNDLKEAMKSKDSFRLGVIRMVKGAMQLAKPNPREELTDDDVIAVISKQIKMRNDSINEFAKAGREDLVNQINEEISYLEKYLPKQLTEEEITVIVKQIIAELGATTMKDMGKVMKAAKEKMGVTADGKTINKVVKENLA